MSQPTFILKVQSGPNKGETFPLGKDVLYIGRDVSNDIVLSDAEVSRKQVRLSRQTNGDYLLEDLGSTNGTFINGQRIVGKQILRAGDVLMLGTNVSLNCELEGDLNATMVSHIAPPIQSAPSSAAPPPSAAPFVGQVSPGPEPMIPEYHGEKKKFPKWAIIGCGVLVLGCCSLTALAYYIDTNYLWCKILPFLAGCG